MRRDLSYARLGGEMLTHNALDKTRGLIAWAGFAPAAAPWCGTAKSDEEDTIKGEIHGS